MAIILYSKELNLLKYWFECLKNNEHKIFVSHNKEELFEYFRSHKNRQILIMDFHEDRSFLPLLRENFSQLNICFLSKNPNIKEASELLKLGVKAYANSHGLALHLQSILQALIEDKFWYYPEVLEVLLAKPKMKKEKNIALVQNTQNLVLANNDGDEKIVVEDDEIDEDTIFTTPYKTSSTQIQLNNKKLINIVPNTTLRLDKTIFYEKNLDSFCKFSEHEYKQILVSLGAHQPQIIAKYQGNFNEYNIQKANSLKGFLVIKDTIKQRDGSDLVNQEIEKFIFADMCKSFEELASIC